MRGWAAVALLAALACGRSTRGGSASGSSGGEPEDPPAASLAPMDARETSQWAAAQQGEPEELMRLADLVGCEGLRERGEEAPRRLIAIQAMQYCRDFSELPWLAQWAAEGADAEAKAALESIVALAARPRRATDPEDAEELHAGCASLLVLARAESRPKDRRVQAIRALRMLADRGCVRRADIPTALDAK